MPKSCSHSLATMTFAAVLSGLAGSTAGAPSHLSAAAAGFSAADGTTTPAQPASGCPSSRPGNDPPSARDSDPEPRPPLAPPGTSLVRRRLRPACNAACLVNYAFTTVLGRAANAQEVVAYTPLMVPDPWQGLEDVATSLAESQEFAAEVLAPNGPRFRPPFEILRTLWRALLFRAPSAAEVRWALPAIQSGAEGVVTATSAILASLEFNEGSARQRILQRDNAETGLELTLREKVRNGAVLTTDFRGTLRHAGRERSFLLHVPSGYFARSGAVPLVILLHPAGSHGEAMVGPMKMTPRADAVGTILLYPDGTSHSLASGPTVLAWNAGHCCGMPAETSVDDVGFLATLIGRLGELFAVDPSRVFATGISNGGMMSHRLAAEHPELIAAIGVTAGTIGGCEGFGCEDLDQSLLLPPVPALPVPAMLFHGFLDTTVPIQGGHGGPQTRYDIQLSQALTALHPEWGAGTGPGSAHGSVDFWVQANGLDNAPLVEQVPLRNGAHCTRLAYDLPEATAEVIAYGCEGIGHTHPTCTAADPQPCLDAPAAYWDFFMEHARL
jgi:polyhydroxybutyrate depolymerase